MLRRSPPLPAIEAFLAAAKAPTFRDAASLLALSPSAFTRRIQALERFVGAPLFDRSGPSPSLNERGARYRDAIADPWETIGLATAGLREASRALRVSASPSLAIEWLMPRLRTLRERSDVEIRLVISAGTTALRKGEADFAIVGGGGAPADFASERLAALEGVIVSAKTLCDGRPPPNTLDDLSDYECLDIRTPPGVWRHWLAAVGRPATACRLSHPFDSLHLMYESAAAGLGLALAVPMASERFLGDGRLRPCLPDRASVGASYELAARAPELARLSSAKRFKTWLFEEAAASMRLFDDRVRASPSPGCRKEDEEGRSFP